MLTNEVGREKSVTVMPDARSLTAGQASAWTAAKIIGAASAPTLVADGPLRLTLPGYGLTVIALEFK